MIAIFWISVLFGILVGICLLGLYFYTNYKDVSKHYNGKFSRDENSKNHIAKHYKGGN